MKKFNNNAADHHRKSKEDYAKEKAEQIALQRKSLEIIASVAKFLDDFLQHGTGYRITMREIITHLNDECGYSAEETKVISQFNYLLMDLANARKNQHISGDRLNIRVLYIEERMKTSYKKELHDVARNIIDTYTTLFKWDEGSTGEEYDTLERK